MAYWASPRRISQSMSSVLDGAMRGREGRKYADGGQRVVGLLGVWGRLHDRYMRAMRNKRSDRNEAKRATFNHASAYWAPSDGGVASVLLLRGSVLGPALAAKRTAGSLLQPSLLRERTWAG